MTPEEFVVMLQGPMRSTDDREALGTLIDASKRAANDPKRAEAFRDISGQEVEDAAREYLFSRPRFANNDRYIELLLKDSIERIQGQSDIIRDRINQERVYPIFATLPFGQPNACTIRVPDSEQTVVAFAEGLPYFINRLAKVAVEAHQSFDLSVYNKFEERHSKKWPKKYAAILKGNTLIPPEVYRNFLLTVAWFAIPGFPQPPRHFPSNPELSTIQRTELLQGAEDFVVAHEYGHALLDHVANAFPRISATISATDVEIVQRSHKQELEADTIGFSLTITIAVGLWKEMSWYDQYLYAIRAAGPAFFFAAANILEKAQALLPTPPQRLNTHPPSLERIALTRTLHEQITHYPPNPFSVEYEAILNHLWESSQSEFESFIKV